MNQEPQPQQEKLRPKDGNLFNKINVFYDSFQKK